MDHSIASHLSATYLFQGLSLEQIVQMSPCIDTEIRQYYRDDFVFRRGEDIEGVGIVLEGELYFCDITGKNLNSAISRIGPNDVFGSVLLYSFDHGFPYHIIARSESRVLYLSNRFFAFPCSRECSARPFHQQVIRNLLHFLSERSYLLEHKLNYLIAGDLQVKIARYLCELHYDNQSLTFEMPLNRDRLADFLSVARPSLSRELMAMRNEGYIRFQRSRVTILNPDALYRLAGGG